MGSSYPSEPFNLAPSVAEALRHWHAADSRGGLLDGLLLYQQALAGADGNPRAATNALLRQALAHLRRRNSLAADLLHLRYQDEWPIDRVAFNMNFAESTVYRHQHEAVQELAEVLAVLEADAMRARLEHVETRLDSPATLPFVGLHAQVEMLADLIARVDAPWLLSVEGIGGIGKTALAVALFRHLGHGLHFHDFAWVSAQPSLLDAGGAIRAKARPALSQEALVTGLLEQLAPQEAAGLLGRPEAALDLLRTVLRRKPHLLVVDNLETVVDLEALLPALRTLVDPSKVVLTSRKRLVGERDSYLYPVPELPEAHALALVRAAGAHHNVAGLASADDAELRPIYAAVGGNPLALLLVAGQLHLHDLPTVLADLQEARGAPVENLYTFIYRRAWDNLDELQRRVLLAMSLVNTHGDNLAFVAATAELPLAAVHDALQQLMLLNLVFASGDLRARRYGIHSLTRSFLHEQVARWR
jgi:hypothetical protein